MVRTMIRIPADHPEYEEPLTARKMEEGQGGDDELIIIWFENGIDIGGARLYAPAHFVMTCSRLYRIRNYSNS